MMKMKWTLSKILFAVAAVIFILEIASIDVSGLNLSAIAFACVAAGLFFEGTM
ncbi:MAG: hypothetical protein ACRDF7_02100 [Candidatus Limnocylindrales bacterium]